MPVMIATSRQSDHATPYCVLVQRCGAHWPLPGSSLRRKKLLPPLPQSQFLIACPCREGHSGREVPHGLLLWRRQRKELVSLSAVEHSRWPVVAPLRPELSSMTLLAHHRRWLFLLRPVSAQKHRRHSFGNPLDCVTPSAFHRLTGTAARVAFP